MAELPPILTQEDNAPIPELDPIFRKQQPIQEPTGYIQTYIDSFLMNPFSQMVGSHQDFMRPRTGPVTTPPLNAMNVRGQAGLALTQEAIPPDASFDLEQWLRADPQRIRWAHKFQDVYSEAAANNVWNHIKDAVDREQRLTQSDHWTAKALGGLTSPDVLLPFGGVRRGVGFINGVLRGAATGLPYIAVNEALALKYNPTATWDNTKENVLYGTALMALLGGGVGMLRKGQSVSNLGRSMIDESANIAGQLAEDGTELPLTRSIAQTEGNGFSPYVARETGSTPTGFASAGGFERIAARQSGWARVVNSGVRAYEDLANRFFGDGGVLFARNRQGLATEPSAFLAAEGRLAKAGDAILDIKNLHANYLTDGLEGATIAGINVRSSLASLGDKVRKIAGKQRMDGKLRTDEFEQEVFKTYIKAQVTGLIDHAIPQVKEGALRLQKFFKEFADDGYAVNYFRSGNEQKFLLRLEGELKNIREQIAELEKFGSRTPVQENTLQMLMRHASSLEKEANIQRNAPMRAPIPFYFPHRWDKSAVLRNEEKLTDILTRHFENSARSMGYFVDDSAIASRVNSTIDNILGRTADDAEEAIPKGLSSDGRAWFTKSRALDIPTELIQDFIDTDLVGVMREYARKAGLGIEYTRAFDSPTGELSINRASIQAAREGKTLEEIATHENDVRTVRDVLMGRVHSYDTIGTKEASILRSWFTLTSMGKAIFSNLAEIARPAWVLGIKENLGYALNALGNTDIVRGMTDELRKNTAGYWELALGMTHRRFIENGPESFGSIGRYNRAVGTVEKPLSYFAAAPYYLLNGVGVLTHFMKNYTGLVASDMVARRIFAVAEGRATSKELEFLASYGISREDAVRIASQPIQRDRGLILTNSANWTDRDAVVKFFSAVEGIQRRVINTPSAADKPTIMMGVIGKGASRVESQMLALPFQLKAWSFGANNKILLSALQGRDANVMAGALGMFGLAYMFNMIKTPSSIWNKQGQDEKLLNAFESSGIAAFYGDLNFMAETASQNTIGIRPIAGMKPKFGKDADEYDVAGEIGGPAVAKILDIYKAFNGGTPRDQARVTVNAIPLNNLFWIPESFRAMSRKTLEEIYR